MHQYESGVPEILASSEIFQAYKSLHMTFQFSKCIGSNNSTITSLLGNHAVEFFHALLVFATYYFIED